VAVVGVMAIIIVCLILAVLVETVFDLFGE